MDDLLAARWQMAFSLGFHMLFAAIGVGMPVLMLIAEGLWLRTGKSHYLELAKKWAKVTGILFAIGAVSGTALSFELGLLWPKFMAFSGGIIGAAFALEGYAFFLEAIFLGLYLYGWDRLSPRTHWLTGIPVAISGAASSVLVVSANAWMQNPTGFTLENGIPVNIDPIQALFNPSWGIMALHSTMATYAATAFAVAAVYAWGVLRGRRNDYHRSAITIAMAVALVTAIVMPITGDMSARWVAENQPVKLAAMEAQFETERGAPLRIGGLPDPDRQNVRFSIDIPNGLSWLAYKDPDAEVMGLDQVPRKDWPNVPLTHIAFQLMVGAGTMMIAISVIYWVLRWRRRTLENRRLMQALVVGGPLGFVGLEAGWIVTEVGRQPWIVYGVMRTETAVTPVPGVVNTFIGFVVLYLFLSVTTVVLLRHVANGMGNLETGQVGEQPDASS